MFDHSANPHFVRSHLSLFAPRQYFRYLTSPWCGLWIQRISPPGSAWSWNPQPSCWYVNIKPDVSLLYLILDKSYPISMCLVRIELDARPFFSSIIALIFSWYNVDLFTSKPWFWSKTFVHKTCADASWTQTSSLIVELAALTFFFFDTLVTQPFLMDIVAPVCPFKSGLVPYDPSTQQWTTFRLFTSR